MTQYAMFLRGVNVGGVNLKMADVASALTDAWFADVRTILATGNVTLGFARRRRCGSLDGRESAAKAFRV